MAYIEDLRITAITEERGNVEFTVTGTLEGHAATYTATYDVDRERFAESASFEIVFPDDDDLAEYFLLDGTYVSAEDHTQAERDVLEYTGRAIDYLRNLHAQAKRDVLDGLHN